MIDLGNFVSLKGRLTADPDYNEQYNVVRFSLARDNAGRKDKESVAGFFDITAWTTSNDYVAPKAAEMLLAAIKDGSLAKGSLVEVTGRLNQDSWSKDGKNFSKVVIIAESVNVVYVKRNTDATASGDSDGASGTAAPAASASAGSDQVPF